VGNRAFYRWLTRDYQALFPQLPERTHLFYLFMMHQAWTQIFLAAPTVLEGIDMYRSIYSSTWPYAHCSRLLVALSSWMT
jgi:hypothetical protein